MYQGVQQFWTETGGAALPRLSRSQGLNIWDTAGNRYLDVTSGPITVNIGHGNERVLAAMRQQAERVCFAYPSSFESECCTELGRRLAAAAGPGLDCAFFVSSGSEAVEKCLQFARRVAIAKGQPGRHKILSRNPSYHGSTIATMALSADPSYAAYLPIAGSLLALSSSYGHYVPAPMSYRPPEGLSALEHAQHCAERLRERIVEADPNSVLAFVMEPVMGFCGGATSAPAEYYRRVREVCDEFGVLLMYDEIVSGMGRTGRFLSADHWPNARPDLVVLAKGLGGGYTPLAAFLAPKGLVELVANAGGFQAGHTHKAHPLSCAVGLAVFDETIRLGLIDRAAEMGQYLRSQLSRLMNEIDIIGEVRGMGLLNAVEIVADRRTKRMLPRTLDVIGALQALALKQGLLIYGRRTHGGQFGDWLMIAPPLITTRAEVDEIVVGLGACLKLYQDKLR